jgi:hypothetical protein
LEHVVVPEPENADPFCGYGSASLFIRRDLAGLVMVTAVQFDAQTGLVTIEVEHVAADRVLPSELGSAKPAASQERPQELLCIGRLVAKPPAFAEDLGRQRLFSLTLPLSRRERELFSLSLRERVGVRAPRLHLEMLS